MQSQQARGSICMPAKLTYPADQQGHTPNWSFVNIAILLSWRKLIEHVTVLLFVYLINLAHYVIYQ